MVLRGGQRDRSCGEYVEVRPSPREHQWKRQILAWFSFGDHRVVPGVLMTHIDPFRRSPESLPFGSDLLDGGGVHVDHDEGWGS
jgi:hypothetical protein